MSTIKQKTVIIDIEGGRRLEVRRMRWKAMRDFLKKLAGIVSSIYGTVKPGEERPTLGTLLTGRLPELVAGSDELVAHICTQSTDLSAEDFDNLDALSAAEVLKAALSINLDEETKNCWAGIGQRLSALMPAPADQKTS